MPSVKRVKCRVLWRLGLGMKKWAMRFPSVALKSVNFCGLVWKERGSVVRTRDQIANIRCIIEKSREFQKNIYFCFIDYAKAFDCVDHNKLWKILQEIGIPDHLTCLLRNLYAGQK